LHSIKNLATSLGVTGRDDIAANHPNFCSLFDIGPNYLVMGLVEGGTPKGPLPLEC
jgi:hypothetical protein